MKVSFIFAPPKTQKKINIMKKVVLLLAVVAMVSSLTSCKKDYACKCTGTILGASYSAESATFKATKKDAEDTCTSSTYTGTGLSCEAVKK